jgi:hypothetical protein
MINLFILVAVLLVVIVISVYISDHLLFDSNTIFSTILFLIFYIFLRKQRGSDEILLRLNASLVVYFFL